MAKKYHTHVFGNDPVSLRTRALKADAPADLLERLGPYTVDPVAVQVMGGIWALTHRWDTGLHTIGGAHISTTTMAMEICHILRVEYMIATRTIATLFEIPAANVSWYCSRWNYVNGTSRQYAYRERS